MKKLHWAWVVIGATVVAGTGIGIAACSSDTTGTGNPTGGGGTDGGRDGTASGDDGSPSGDDSSAGDDTSTGQHDCGFYPVKLHPTDDAGTYCPFQVGPDGGELKGNCPLYDTCCTYKADSGLPSQCIAGDRNGCDPKVDAGGAFFECGEQSDCNGTGKTCCLIGTPTKDPTCLDPTSHEFGSKVKGTYCSATGCKAGEFTVCGVQTECADAGGTCTPFSTKTIEIGACVQ